MLTDNVAQSNIKDFWEWIAEHSDDVGVQFMDDDRFYLYIAFDHDILEEFTNRYQYHVEEGGCSCLIQTNGLCFDLRNLEGGYGFTMKELWDNRPKGIEDTLGGNLY